MTLRHLHLYVAAAVWHISHGGESTVDQMRALIRNSHRAWARPARDTHEDLLQLQLRKRRTSASEQKRPPKRKLQLLLELPELELPELGIASKARISRRNRRNV